MLQSYLKVFFAFLLFLQKFDVDTRKVGNRCKVVQNETKKANVSILKQREFLHYFTEQLRNPIPGKFNFQTTYQVPTTSVSLSDFRIPISD
jgi:hypothetical protein